MSDTTETTETTTAERNRLRRWILVVLLIVANAAAQALLVAADPIPAVSPWFALLVLASFAAITVTVWQGCALLEPPTPAETDRHSARLRLLAWSGVGVLVVAIAGVIAPALAVVPALLAAFVLPSVAAAEKNPFRHAASAFRRHPARAIVTVIGGVVLLMLNWLAALLFGFLIAGWSAAVLTWVFFGFSGAVLLGAVRALR